MNLLEIKKQIAEKISEYFSGNLTAEDLYNWAVEHPHFIEANKNPSTDDLIIDTALATMVTLGEEPADLHSTDEDLKLAYEYVVGERPFPEENYIPKHKRNNGKSGDGSQ